MNKFYTLMTIFFIVCVVLMFKTAAWIKDPTVLTREETRGVVEYCGVGMGCLKSYNWTPCILALYPKEEAACQQAGE